MINTPQTLKKPYFSYWNRAERGVCVCVRVRDEGINRALVRRWFTHTLSGIIMSRPFLHQHKDTLHPSRSFGQPNSKRPADIIQQVRTAILTEERQSESCQLRVATSFRERLEKANIRLEKAIIWYFELLLHVCAFFFKNGYPGKERASKDTHLQVTKLVWELNLCMTSFIWSLENDFTHQFCFRWASWNVHVVLKRRLVMMSSSAGNTDVRTGFKPHNLCLLCSEGRSVGLESDCVYSAQSHIWQDSIWSL